MLLMFFMAFGSGATKREIVTDARHHEPGFPGLMQ